MAHSWAGAKGLMQIMPATAAHLGLPASQIHEPEPNVAAATKLIRELDGKFNDITDRMERIRFILASYNGGHGHIRDAMALARKYRTQSPTLGRSCTLRSSPKYIAILQRPSCKKRLYAR